MSDNVGGGLLKGNVGATTVFAITPLAQTMRNTKAGVQVKVIGNGTTGSWKNEDQFFDQWTQVIPGIITIGERSGRRAHTVLNGTTVAVVTMVTNPTGPYFTHVRVDVGGVMGDGAPIVPIPVFVADYGLKWVSTSGEPARPEQVPLREGLTALIQEGGIAQTQILKVLITGGDSMLDEYMFGLGVLDRHEDGRKAGWLAQILAVTLGLSEAYTSLMVCLAEFAKKAGSDLQGNGPGDEQAATAGQLVIESFATLVMGLPMLTIHDVKRHEFPNGRLIGRDAIPPGELGAFLRTVLEKVAYFTCAAARTTLKHARERASRTCTGVDRGQ